MRFQSTLQDDPHDTGKDSEKREGGRLVAHAGIASPFTI